MILGQTSKFKSGIPGTSQFFNKFSFFWTFSLIFSYLFFLSFFSGLIWFHKALTNNIQLGSNTIWSDFDTGFKLYVFKIDQMYMKLISEIFWHELSVWMRKGRREKRFGLDCLKNKNKISTNFKKKLNKDYLSLFLLIFKIIWIFSNPNNKIQRQISEGFN